MGVYFMHRPIVRAAVVVSASVLLPAAKTARTPALADEDDRRGAVRFATFNASLNRGFEGQLVQDLSTGGNARAAAVVEIIQRARPDIVLVNEFDFDEDGEAARLFPRRPTTGWPISTSSSNPRRPPRARTERRSKTARYPRYRVGARCETYARIARPPG